MAGRIGILMVMMWICLLCLPTTAVATVGAGEFLTITGSGVEREISFSRAELEAMSDGISQHVYSVTNNFPNNKIMYRKGVSLAELLKQAGLKESAKQLQFIAADGYARNFTYQELLIDRRYCFETGGSALEVPVIIAFADSSKGFAAMSPVELVLTMGQRVPGEQTNPWFVKYLRTIVVGTSEPGQWPQVTFTQTAEADRMTVQLHHTNFDAVKIHYTLDGTEPTINSQVYNISASYYQPALNQPIVVPEKAEIKAIAIGAGKTNSAVMAATISRGAGGSFTDLDDYQWARPAIEELATKGIIRGMSSSRFVPGEPLTRAQFASLMVAALGEQPAERSGSAFSDVKPGDWFYSSVEKARELGLINGYPDGSFRPEQVLSRQEMIALVVQSMQKTVGPEATRQELPASFATASRISEWAWPLVVQAEILGLLEHGHVVMDTADGLLIDAQQPAARAEAAAIVWRMLGKKNA